MHINKGSESFKAYRAEHPQAFWADYSQLDKFEQCPRLYSYRYREKLKDVMGPGALFSSLLIHPPLSLWYTTPTALFNWQLAWSAFVGHLDGRSVTYTLKKAQQIVDSYMDRFKPDLDMYTIESSEEVYWRVLEDGDRPLVWLSKPDLLLRRADNKLVSCDFKTSKWHLNADLKLHDRQLLGQAFTTGATYMMKTHIEMPTRGPEFVIDRSIEPVEEDQLEEWRSEITLKLRHIQDCVDKDIWPKSSPRACTDFNRNCSFLELCNLGSARKFVIQDFNQDNPLDYLGL